MNPVHRPALLAAALLFALQTSVRGEDVDRRQLYVKSVKSCVAILTSGGPASGWVVDLGKRWVVTCQHVVGTRGEVDLVFPILKNGRVFHDRDWYAGPANRVKGKVLSADPRRDLAIVEAETLPEGFRALSLAADSGQPADTLHMIGNPAASGAMWNYSTGTLRAVYQKRFHYKGTAHEVDALVGETQLPGNAGDSGAAVFNDRGEVLGVHSGGSPDGVQLMSTYIDVTEVRAFLAEPLTGPVKARTFDDFFTRGTENYARGALDEALADYSEAVRLKPTHSESYRCRAGVYIRKKQFDKALADCQEALRLDPANASAYNERAVCHAAAVDLQAALADYSEAIRLNPNDFMFWNGRAWTRNRLKQFDKALADATEALRLKPRSAFALHERGLARLGLEQYEEALADLRQAIQLEPGNVQALYHRGMASAALGDNQAALKDFDEALRLNPKHAQAYLGRGRVLQALGQQAQADADYRRAVELDPSLVRPR